MTTNENPTEETIHLSPLMASILTASAKQTEWATNQVLDSKDREIADWKAAFAKLYDAIDIANKTVDSLRIERILDSFAQKRDWSVPDVDFH